MRKTTVWNSLNTTILDYIDIYDYYIDNFDMDDRSRRITEEFLSAEMKYPWCL